MVGGLLVEIGEVTSRTGMACAKSMRGKASALESEQKVLSRLQSTL